MAEAAYLAFPPFTWAVASTTAFFLHFRGAAAICKTAADRCVGGLNIAGFEFRQSGELTIDRCEVGRRLAHQLLEAIDYEIGFLKIVDAISRAQDAL